MITYETANNSLNYNFNNLLKINLCTVNSKKVESCPRCKCKKYIKYGYYHGVQRYKCKECGKTFSLTSNFIWKYSKKPAKKWNDFIEMMLEQRSLRKTAEILNISLNTAFRWRHKIIKLLENMNIPKYIEGDIFISKTFFKENFKGCRNIKKTERDKIWVITAKGKYDSYLITPVCKRNWDYNSFKNNIIKRINKKSCVKVYNDAFIRYAMKKYKSIEESDNMSVKLINMKMKKWFKPFRGINSRYLQRYLCWFILYVKQKEYSSIRLLYDLCKVDIQIYT